MKITFIDRILLLMFEHEEQIIVEKKTLNVRLKILDERPKIFMRTFNVSFSTIIIIIVRNEKNGYKNL
jgi:hypothetical protein